MSKQCHKGTSKEPKETEKDIVLQYSESDNLITNNEEQIIESELEAVINQVQLNIGNFIYVELKNKSKLKCKNRSNHFVGQIVSLEDEDVEVSFIKQNENYFWWPEPLSTSWVDISDIHLRLNTPDMDRRQHLIFTDDDIENMNKCCI